jgi:uncharacterized membrane protein
MKQKKIMLFLTAILVGLTAGIFFDWSFTIMPGLAPLPDDQYILAFQSLNRKIQNPVFFLCFIGPVIALPLSAWMQWGTPGSIRTWLLVGAAVVYIVGVIGITGVGNIPLNDALDAFDVRNSTTAQIAQQRALFEGPWNRLNNWRTVACLVTFGLTLAACFKWEEAAR